MMHAEKKLREFIFSDLFIGSGMEPVIKGLQPSSDSRIRSSAAIRVPHILLGDVETLHRAIIAHAVRIGMREFVIDHEGLKYRVSMIATPAAKFRSPEEFREFLSDAGWCVRRVGTMVPDIDGLNLSSVVKVCAREVTPMTGLVIIGGSVGSGKTTTASAILRDWVISSRESAVAFEDPPEFPLADVFPDGGVIHQVEVTHTTLAEGLRYARRWSPRYVFVGEIRSPEAAAEVLHLGISGPLVICTIHAADLIQCMVSITRYASNIMSESEARRLLASSLRLLIHQRMTPNGVEAEAGRLYGQDAATLRARVETGNFQSLAEEFDRQKIWARRMRA